MDCLRFIVFFLNPDLSLLKHSLCLCYTFEKAIAFLIDYIGLC